MTSDMSCSTSRIASPARQPSQKLVEPGRVGLIESGRGLVEQQNRRARRECARDLQEPAIDMGQVLAGNVIRAGIAEKSKQRARKFRRCFRAPAAAKSPIVHCRARSIR